MRRRISHLLTPYLVVLLALTTCPGRAVVVSGLSGTDASDYITTPGVLVNGINVDGVGDLIVNTPGGTFRSSASLLWTGQHLLTAAHSVTDNAGALDLTSGTIRFDLPGQTVQLNLTPSMVTVHPAWNGDALNGFDAAIIDLGALVNPLVPRYDIFDGDVDSIIGLEATMVGYGRAGVGATGHTIASGTKRWGLNTYDGYFTPEPILLYDFDDGTVPRDAMRALFGPQYADLGLGVDEADSAPGDSGGPKFVEDPGNPGHYLIAGVTSFGSTVSTDIDSTTNSSFGELSGDLNVTVLANWIYVTVPEPSTWLLVSLALLATGLARRRRTFSRKSRAS